MPQRHITINAYPLTECRSNSFTIAFNFREKSPSKLFAIETVADCKAALKAFAAELEPTGKPWHLSVSFDKKSGRKPAGFDKAQTARELECHVNSHLASPKAA
ncbi:MAG: hypothetical protein ACLPPF_18915 [Rhodomicrobium sp.]